MPEQSRVFPARVLWKSRRSKAQIRSKAHQNLQDDHKDLVNLPTKGIDDSLHGLRGIDEIPSKNGVFSKYETLKNFDPKELVNPRGFALGKRA